MQGTGRSDRVEWKDDVSVKGLGETIKAVQKLHNAYPSTTSLLVGKQATKPKFPTPESIPSLSSRFTGNLITKETL